MKRTDKAVIRRDEALCLCGNGTTRRVVLAAAIGFAQRICRACGSQATVEEVAMTGLGFNRGAMWEDQQKTTAIANITATGLGFAQRISRTCGSQAVGDEREIFLFHQKCLREIEAAGIAHDEVSIKEIRDERGNVENRAALNRATA